ncbi:MAG: exopolysaccharide biosynthesis polyprenyl glycosylphosphotransferase [Kiritimatiellaceae bacterium]|nr:exopolysaccharide biosynthesis polyprenyl glycosylphosphotransferase [Kiritimatiellaceae bacterium]
MSKNELHVNVAECRAHPFLRRRLTDVAMMHLSDGLVLFFSMLIGDLVLYFINDIPVQLRPMLLMIPCWWVGSWIAHIVPGWGMGIVEELRRIQLLLLLLFSSALIVVFLQRETGISRITFLVAYAVATVLIPLGRVLSRSFLTKLGLWGVPVVIYGDRDSVPMMTSALHLDHSLGYIPTAILSDDFKEGDFVHGLRVLGGIHYEGCRLPVAVVALPEMARRSLIQLLEGPMSAYKTVLLVPDLRNAPSLWVKPCDLQGILALELQRNLHDPLASFLKTFIERAVILFTLPLWGTLCLFLMGLVWIQDRHSPVYAQERVGKKNKNFKAYKLRTMVFNSEEVLQQKLAESPELKAEWEQHYKLKSDPRITWIGSFLRKTSLDEIPQFWCVLMGTMALVGPRPLPAYHHAELKDRTQRLRVKVRPGITGLWQVSGRSDSGTEGMNRWDTYYVTNWSIWLDLVIIARTVRVVLFGSGAY